MPRNLLEGIDISRYEGEEPSEETLIPKYGGGPRNLLEGIDAEKYREPEEEEERIPEDMYGAVGHSEVAGMTEVPEEHRDTLGDIAQSIAMGTHRDVIKFNNFLASNPVTRALLHPVLGDVLKEREVPELGEAPVPGLAKATASLTPWLVPYGGIAKGLGIARGAAGIAGKLPALAKTLENISRASPIAAKAAGLAGRGAAETAAIERVFGEEGDEPSKLAEAAIAGGLINVGAHGVLRAIPHGLSSGVKALKRVSEIVKNATGNKILTPEEAGAVLESIGDNEIVPLPDLVKMPKLSSVYHGFMRWIPFSGVKEQEARLIDHVEKEGSSLLSNLIGKEHATRPIDNVDIRESIAQSFRGEANKVKEESAKLYNNVFDRVKDTKFRFLPDKVAEISDKLHRQAEDAGVKVSELVSPAFAASLRGLTKGLEEEVPMIGKMQAEGKLLEAIRKAADKEGGLRRLKIGLDTLKRFRTEVGEQLARNRGKPDEGWWKKLYGAINDDFLSSAEKTGASELVPLWERATNFYKKEYVPIFKDKTMANILAGKKVSADTPKIENILTSHDYRNIFSKFPEEARKKLTYLLLDKNIPNDSDFVADRLGESIKKLMPDQWKRVVPDSVKKEIETFSKKYEVAKPSYVAFKGNFLDALRKAVHAKHAATYGGAALLGSFLPYRTLLGLVHGVAPYAAGAGLLGARVLRSPKLLEAYTKGGVVPGEIGAKRAATGLSALGLPSWFALSEEGARQRKLYGGED